MQTEREKIEKIQVSVLMSRFRDKVDGILRTTHGVKLVILD